MAEHLKQIGSVDKLAGSVSVRHPDGSQSSLQAGSPVYQGDQVETAADGRVGIVFVDKSTFSLGPKGRMTMDEMVFDPAHPQDGHATVAALNGAFSYVSGQIAKSAPEAMQIRTPVMTIGVRGTTVAGMAAAEGSANTVTLMRDGTGQLGQIVITTAAGSVVLNGESHTIQISSFIQPPPRPTALSAAAIAALYGNALSAQPQPPAPSPEAPPAPTPEGQNGQGGQLQTPGGQTQQVTLNDPANAEQVVQFVSSVLNQIQNPDVVQDVFAMLADLNLWTIQMFEDEQRSLGEILADMEMTEQEFLALVEADAEDEDYYDDTGDEDYASDDQLNGEEIEGTDGNDVLHGTPYDDTIWGMGGDDTLYGDEGDDTLGGGDGADTLYGEGGDDLVFFSRDSSIDTYYGGTGSDTLSFSEVTGVGVTVDLYTDVIGLDGIYDRFYDFENVTGTNQDDYIDGDGSTNVIRGLGGNDIIYANGGGDVLYGDAGNDKLYGSTGSDTLYGGDGSDSLNGGSGSDVLYGGAGIDYFRFMDEGDFSDVIRDYNSSEDVIQIFSSNSTKFYTSVNPRQSDGSIDFSSDPGVYGPGFVFYQDGSDVDVYYNSGVPGESYQIVTVENANAIDVKNDVSILPPA